PDYTLPNQTALVVPPKNPKALARAILKLLKDEPLLKDISKAGYQHIKQYSWGKATRKLEGIFLSKLEPEIDSQIKVAIIVLNWNQKRMTTKCVASLIENDWPNYKIIVADNNSTDGSPEYLKQKFGAKIFLLKNPKNLGYAEGNNQALKWAQKQDFDYFLVVNNDCEFAKNFLTEMLRAAAIFPEAGMIAPKVFYAQRPNILQYTGGEFVWRYGEARLRGNLKEDLGQFNYFSRPDFASGVCLLVSRDLLEKIGLIPNKYFMYSEDVDWSFRAKKAGFEIIYQPAAQVWHYDSYSSGAQNPIKSYYYIRNIWLVIAKWANINQKILFLVFFHWKLLKMIIKDLLAGNYKNIKAIIAGYRAFAKGETGENSTYTFNNYRQL
ncbi:MAG TPA: glycosyltransferase, partial [Patescibacteria group bacterium]|nr:glycosyltransferase [Patescibacteria group bacterium]